jgi:hypothetical protein
MVRIAYSLFPSTIPQASPQPIILQLSVWSAVRISGVVASFHPRFRFPITSIGSKPFWHVVVLPMRLSSVGFAHVVVVPVMRPAVLVFDVFPANLSQRFTTPTVAAGQDSVEHCLLEVFCKSIKLCSLRYAVGYRV